MGASREASGGNNTFKFEDRLVRWRRGTPRTESNMSKGRRVKQQVRTEVARILEPLLSTYYGSGSFCSRGGNGSQRLTDFSKVMYL